jgi:hypothetical protein
MVLNRTNSPRYGLSEGFVAPNAKIAIYPKKEVINEGIQFDTPYSPIKRKSNQSAF